MLIILQNFKFRFFLINVIFNDFSHQLHFLVHAWLTLSITDSPFWVGAVFGLHGLGMVMFSIFAGVLVDTIDRRKLIVVSQLIHALMSFVLAILIFYGQIQLWHMLIIGFGYGAVASISMPATMTLTLDIVGRDKLLSGVAITFAVGSFMAIISPVIGSRTVDTLGIEWVYILISISLVIAALMMTFIRDLTPIPKRNTSPLHDMKTGLNYAMTTPAVRILLIMNLVTASMGWSHDSMLSVMARDVLKVGVSGLGYMIAIASLGGTIATLLVSNQPYIKEKAKLLLGGLVAFGVFLIIFSLSRWFPLSLLALALAYASAMVYETIHNTILQTIVPDDMRGRMLSFVAITWGMSSISGFHTGAIAAASSAPIAIAIGGSAVVLSAIALSRTTMRSKF